MSLQVTASHEIPEETKRVAQAAFANGNRYILMRDKVGVLFSDEAFVGLFPRRGQPAEAPGRLALITVLQFAKGLSDREAADAVRGLLRGICKGESTASLARELEMKYDTGL